MAARAAARLGQLGRLGRLGRLARGGTFAVLLWTAAPPTGVWEAVRVNNQALPMTDKVIGEDKYTHVIKLQSMTIRLLPNGRFQAALKYRRAILSKGQQVETQPLLNDTWVGPYTLTGTHMQFNPEKKGSQQVQAFTGEMNGRRITVTFDYEIVTRKHYILDLDKNDNIL